MRKMGQIDAKSEVLGLENPILDPFRLDWEDRQRHFSGGIGSSMEFSRPIEREIARNGGCKTVFDTLIDLLHGNSPR